MFGTVARCIYCGRFFNPSKGQGDHVFAVAAFGEFDDDIRFRGGCLACNHRIGRCEQELSQSSHLGMFRRIVDPDRGRRSGRGTKDQRGTCKSQRPIRTVEFEGQSILAKPAAANPCDSEGLDQLVITDSDGVVHRIELFHGMSQQSLRTAIERTGSGPLREAVFICDPNDADHFTSRLQNLYPTAGLTDQRLVQGGTMRVPTRTEFRFGVGYFRALAKLAFHYYLTRNSRGLLGNEPGFAPLRRFIRQGGDKDAFFHSAGRVIAHPFGRKFAGYVGTPPSWCHRVACDESTEFIVVCLYLFAGPNRVPEATYVTLGQFPHRVALPKPAWGHAYEYVETDGRRRGRVRAIGLSPIPIPRREKQAPLWIAKRRKLVLP